MKRSNLIKILFLALIAAGVSACKTVDIRPKYALENRTKEDYNKGKELLKTAYLTMGYDKLESKKTYQVNAYFKWKPFWTIVPLNSLPGSKRKDIVFRFTTNTFDGSVEFLEGRKKGKIYGIQSWQTYVIDQKKDGQPKKIKHNRFNWGLATYHYVIESPMRLLGAEIIRYAGERIFRGQSYDLVYATWGKDEPHKEHDQWLVYINKETGLIDLTEITINDFFLPMPKGMRGATIQTQRVKNEEGIYLPSLVTIQLGKPKRQKRHVYTFSLEDYKFDEFPISVLTPLEDVAAGRDAKKEDEL